jgi:hypothetical protein
VLPIAILIELRKESVTPPKNFSAKLSLDVSAAMLPCFLVPALALRIAKLRKEHRQLNHEIIFKLSKRINLKKRIEKN